MNRRLLHFVGIGLVLAALSACEGAGTGGDLEVIPNEARAGEAVLLSGNLAEGDTVCFVRQTDGKAGAGCGFPSVLESLTQSADDEGRMEARVTLPKLILPGRYEIRVGSGEEFSDGADLTVLPGGDISTPVETKPEGEVSSGGEVIVPDSGDVAGSPYANEDDASGGGDLPPEPEALSASLAGTEALHDTRLGMVKISFKATGSLKALYVYGPFTGDSDCDDSLAIDPSGNDLNPGSPNAQKYEAVSSGDVCDPATDNCREFMPQAGDGVFCRINLPAVSGTFYTRMHQKESTYVLVAEGTDGEIRTSKKTVVAPDPTLGASLRISPSDPHLIIRADVTRAAALPTVAYSGLCHQAWPPASALGPDGSGYAEWTCGLTQEKTVTITVRGVGLSSVQETLRLRLEAPDLSFKNGSLYQTGQSIRRCTGSGGDWWKSCDAKGDLQLYGAVTRKAVVERETSPGNFAAVESFQTAWVKAMAIVPVALSTYQPPQGAPIVLPIPDTSVAPTELPSSAVKLSGDSAEMSVKRPRNLKVFTYWFAVTDFDGTSQTKSLSFPYEPKLEISKAMVNGREMTGENACTYNPPSDECDKCLSVSCDTTWCVVDGSCSEKWTFIEKQVDWNWTAKNCRELVSSCGGRLDFQAPTGADGTYLDQKGKVSLLQKASGQTCRLTCKAPNPSDPDLTVTYRLDTCEDEVCHDVYGGM